MHLKPMRRSWHDINDVDTLAQCPLNDHRVNVNAPNKSLRDEMKWWALTYTDTKQRVEDDSSPGFRRGYHPFHQMMRASINWNKRVISTPKQWFLNMELFRKSDISFFWHCTTVQEALKLMTVANDWTLCVLKLLCEISLHKFLNNSFPPFQHFYSLWKNNVFNTSMNQELKQFIQQTM